MLSSLVFSADYVEIISRCNIAEFLVGLLADGEHTSLEEQDRANDILFFVFESSFFEDFVQQVRQSSVSCVGTCVGTCSAAAPPYVCMPRGDCDSYRHRLRQSMLLTWPGGP